MPPSPSFSRTPSLEPQANTHKRGRSFESGVAFKGKDDDLALFNEMQSREDDNFLLQPGDDFENIFSSKVKPFPEVRLGINIPSRGGSSDLLSVEAGKNDYDWLLTPPDTPLFPSLDDDPAPGNLVHNGRAHSRPISISRSSTMEKRSSRGGPSPQCLTPSPGSGTSIFRGRPSSAPHTNVPSSRSGTPSRRPSPPPVKPSTPHPITSTPPPIITSGVRGTSPVRTNRGNSASPKVRAWQSNIPGFSLEVPPNLRTSLADRPATYVRGSSPASRASNSSSKFNRHSISPTASRSISSSHSQERNRLSSQSKGSVVSSCDDDADSLQSIPVRINERPMSRRVVNGFSNSKSLAFSKKPTKTFSPSSAPKRSFDSAIRQLDRKIPQNMFRQLLSSVPSSTFYAGKNSVAHRAMISGNSSVTTSSNASSDQATSGAHDTEESDLYQDDMASESARAPFSDVQDEVFAIDEMDVVSEDIGLEAHGSLSNAQHNGPDKSCIFASITCDSEESGRLFRPTSTSATSEVVDMQGDLLETDSHEKTLLCSVCVCRYQTEEIAESERNICPQCKRKAELLTAHNSSIPLVRINEELNQSDHNLAVPGSSLKAPLIEGDTLGAGIYASPALHSSSDNSLTVRMGEETIHIAEESRTIHQNASHASNSLIEMHRSVDEVTEGQGISVLLLKRSSSLRGPLIHGRTFPISSTSYDDLLNTRDLTSSMRSSVGHGSTSTSFSADLASTRHGEVVQRELSGRRDNTNSQHQRSISSLSGTSMKISQGFGVSTSSLEESRETPVNNMQQIVAKETDELPSVEVLAVENGGSQNHVPASERASVSEEASRTKDASVMVSSTCMESSDFDNFRVSIDINDGHVLNEIGNNSEKKSGEAQLEETVFIESSQVEESTMSDNQVNKTEVAHDPQCALAAMSEVELDDSHPSSPRSQVDLVSRENLEDASATMHLNTDQDDRVVDESIVTVEDQEHEEGSTRSLTLEEATSAILFCSSIVHDLAYKAASIAIDKEKENLKPLEVSRPTITIPEKRSDPRERTGRKKTQKARKSSAETEPKSLLTKHEEKANESVVRNIGVPNNDNSMKPSNLESKCNCTIM